MKGAPADPAARTDLVLSLAQLALVARPDDPPAAADLYRRGPDIAERLAAEGRLPPAYAVLPAHFRGELAKLGGRPARNRTPAESSADGAAEFGPPVGIRQR